MQTLPLAQACKKMHWIVHLSQKANQVGVMSDTPIKNVEEDVDNMNQEETQKHLFFNFPGILK